MEIENSIALTIGVKDRLIEVFRKTDAVKSAALSFCVYRVSMVYQHILDRDHITLCMSSTSFTLAKFCWYEPDVSFGAVIAKLSLI
jgi:hypothetical protein